MSDYELITSEIAEELEAGSFTVKQRIFIKEYLKCLKGSKNLIKGPHFANLIKP
jgi:hypothetical protein